MCNVSASCLCQTGGRPGGVRVEYVKISLSEEDGQD